jgi:hypothetical protein
MTSEVTRWEQVKKRFQNSLIGVIILGALAAGLFLTNALGVWDQVVKHLRPAAPDLLLTSLSEPNRPKPLDGYEFIQVSTGSSEIAGLGAVYPRGARISIDLAHNREGDATITLRGLELNIENFRPGPQPTYAYKALGDEVIGAGPIKPLVYHVALFGNRVGPAMRVIDPKRGGLIARSGNFLDTEDPELFELSKADDKKSLNVVVTAEEAGLYQISFTFTYSVLGHMKQRRTAPPVLIYYERS